MFFLLLVCNKKFIDILSNLLWYLKTFMYLLFLQLKLNFVDIRRCQGVRDNTERRHRYRSIRECNRTVHVWKSCSLDRYGLEIDAYRTLYCTSTLLSRESFHNFWFLTSQTFPFQGALGNAHLEKKILTPNQLSFWNNILFIPMWYCYLSMYWPMFCIIK